MGGAAGRPSRLLSLSTEASWSLHVQFHSAPSQYVRVLRSGKRRAWERFPSAFNCGKKPFVRLHSSLRKTRCFLRTAGCWGGIARTCWDTIDGQSQWLAGLREC